jgi:glutamyl-tRNA reductase
LSTVDRTEVMVLADAVPQPVDEIRQLLAAQAGIQRSEIATGTYALTGLDALKHLFAVSAGLDGLVMGDPRVVGQVRAAVQLARRRGTIGERLAPLVERASVLADAIARETELTLRPSSIPAAAVHVARDLHGDLVRCRGLLVGAGEMGELLAQSLIAAGLAHLTVTHPNRVRGEQAAQILDCHAADFTELPQLLESADIVVTSINTRRYVLGRDQMRAAIAARRRRPIFVIDTGVPGDVDPAISSVEDAFVYTLDDLERVIRTSARGGEKAVARAREMVSAAAAEFVDKLPAAEAVGDAVEALRREAIRLAGGDAEKATRLLVERLLRLRKDS